MSGGSIYDLQKILGHTRIEMSQRYSHLTQEYLRRVIQVVSFGGVTTDTDTDAADVTAKEGKSKKKTVVKE